MSPRQAPRPCSEPGCPNLDCVLHKKRGGYVDERESSAKRGYGRSHRKLRLMFLRAHPFCECGAVATIADHIIPKRAGGKNTWDNMQAMCHGCHNRKIAEEKRAGLI